MNGLAIEVSRRKSHTLSYLLAAPGELEEPGDLLKEGAHNMLTKEKSNGNISEENREGTVSGVDYSTATKQDEYAGGLTPCYLASVGRART